MAIQRSALFFIILVLTNCSSNDINKTSDCSTIPVLLQLVSQTNVTSCSANDGIVEVSASGGQAPYEYRINGGTFSTSSIFQNLTTGSYTIETRDANGCIGTLSPSADIINPNSDLSATVPNSSSDTECLSDNGSLTVAASGGVPPYLYKLGIGAFTSDAIFTNIASGSYTITVKDAEGCTFSVNKSVTRGDTGVSWSGKVEGIIDTNCAISGCHNGNQFPDLRELGNVQTNKTQIRSRTQSGNMPRNGSLTSEEKANIACWIDDGAKNN